MSAGAPPRRPEAALDDRLRDRAPVAEPEEPGVGAGPAPRPGAAPAAARKKRNGSAMAPKASAGASRQHQAGDAGPGAASAVSIATYPPSDRPTSTARPDGISASIAAEHERRPRASIVNGSLGEDAVAGQVDRHAPVRAPRAAGAAATTGRGSGASRGGTRSPGAPAGPSAVQGARRSRAGRRPRGRDAWRTASIGAG